MKTKPWTLVVLALLHIIAPFGNMLVNAMRAGRSLSAQWHYWFDIIPKPLLLIYLGVPVLAGVFIFLCRRWSYWAYLGCIALIFLSNLYSYWTSMTWSTLLALLVILVVDVLVVAYFVVPSVQKIYFDPRMRWWEAAPRYNFNHEGQVNGQTAFLKNLSQGGMFMTSGPSLNEGEKVEVSWNYEGQEAKVPGLVVYKGNQGQGVGVRFEHTADSPKVVKQAVQKLHQKGLIVVERLPGPEDSFVTWLKKLVTKGEGIFPKIRS